MLHRVYNLERTTMALESIAPFRERGWVSEKVGGVRLDSVHGPRGSVRGAEQAVSGRRCSVHGMNPRRWSDAS
ncbi:uncharacterized protein CMC5_062760 [Chondromyces crocatus]|uniref:Uncharacterized protein n=1 Tax=Chondromyces crocatus TaxID=52 RepID=A0A0K1EN47_CHOCO|nr:uncharacterized protein CMC5_062760 [Chondromyces crocatus]